jgi:PAS domain S-box-containing protein
MTISALVGRFMALAFLGSATAMNAGGEMITSRSDLTGTGPYAIVLLLGGLGFYLLREENRRHTRIENELQGSIRALDAKAEARTLAIASDAALLKEETARRIAAERALSETGERLHASLQFSKVAAWTWDPAADKITWFGSVSAVFDVDAGSLDTYAAFREAILHEDRATVDSKMANALRDGADYDAEFRIALPDGEIRWLSGRGRPIFDHNGKVVQMAGVNFDISERKTAELRLQESEKHFRELAEAMPQIVWRSSPTGEIDYCNERFTEYTGYSLAELTVRGWNSLIHPDDVPKSVETSTNGFAGGEPFELEYRIKRASDGSYRWFLTRSIPYRDVPANIIRWFATSTDIHEQKLAKERLEEEVAKRTAQLGQSLDRLAHSLREKETLLKELHHRVKNNLQVISSLLHMQGDSLSDQRAVAALQDSRQRVLSMALVHDRLFGNQQTDRVDFAEYSRALVTELLHSFHADKAGRVTSCFNLSHVQLSIDQAIPCGLILNELVTNALKYAYPSGSGGEISIDLNETPEGLVTLDISDQGVGMPAGFDSKKTRSMGLPIVETLAKQMGGNLNIQSPPGTRFSVVFTKDTRDPKTASAH